MPSRKPVPAVLPWLTALAAAPLVVIVAAVAATRFGGVDVGLAYDVLTWTVARGLAWVALAAALVVAGLAFRDLKGRGLYAVAALILAGTAVVGFQVQAASLATETPRDVTSNGAEPPTFSRLAAIHRGQTPAGPDACTAARSIPTQVLAQQAAAALVDASFPVVRATTFEVEGVHEGAWFGFAHDAVVRIRPGRTDIRVAARDRTRPDGGATCRLAGKLADALEAAAR
ncbi:DUF1499 domain-containing protein [Brevundimonas sp.]|uniref:DUF1499 domain-containing protein n=1 Tax=Brevundimonas sp. TaxID=1871086 RepID=UPI0019C06FAB|nr:DUF1499 domain-containing protein [Brevundimonas sp.]MBD3837067.1 DUF1499 domain-containing protein [Brevundimonas sp.]